MARLAKPRYFVMQLGKDSPQRGQGYQFQIQVLDSTGRARSVVYLGLTEKELVVDNRAIPSAVIDAARRQSEGTGDYVNENGESVHPITGIVR